MATAIFGCRLRFRSVCTGPVVLLKACLNVFILELNFLRALWDSVSELMGGTLSFSYFFIY